MADQFPPAAADADPNNAKMVRLVDGYVDRFSFKGAVDTTTTTIATATSEDIATTDAGVTIVSDGTLQYNPRGAATANSGFIPTVYIIHGGKSILDLCQFYAAASTVVSFHYFEVLGV